MDFVGCGVHGKIQSGYADYYLYKDNCFSYWCSDTYVNLFKTTTWFRDQVHSPLLAIFVFSLLITEIQLTLWSWVVLEKTPADRLLKNFQTCSQEPATDTHPELQQSSSYHPHHISLRYIIQYCYNPTHI
jgi:hypothetical protein